MKINVTQPSLPPLDEFHESLKKIWDSKWITNGGPFHEELEQKLAEYLGDDVTLVAKHNDYLKLVKMSPPAGADTTFTSAAPCNLHTGVFNAKGKRSNPKHNMFVDDNLIAETRAFIFVAMAASIEALFCIFGRPQPELRKSPLCMEKFVKATCSYEKVQLGKLTNTRTMTVHMSTKMTAKIIMEIDHWHSKRRSFTIRQAARLLGLLEHAAT